MATVRTYREVRRKHRALKEMTQVRDGGLVPGADGQPPTYKGHLVLPARAQLRIRKMLHVLTPFEDDLTETIQGITSDLTESSKDRDGEAHQTIVDLKTYNRRVRDALDAEVAPPTGGEDGAGGVEVEVLKATDIGDDALEDVAHLLADLGDLFEDDTEPDGDGEPKAGDPTSRAERRQKKRKAK